MRSYSPGAGTSFIITPVKTSFGWKRAELEAKDLFEAKVVFFGAQFWLRSYVPGGGTGFSDATKRSL